MPISRNLVAAALLTISATATANCSLPPYFAPSLPELEQSSYSEVMALRPQVQNFIEKEEARLGRCRDAATTSIFNMRVAQLHRLARDYNALVEFYNRAAAEILASADISGGNS